MELGGKPPHGIGEQEAQGRTETEPFKQQSIEWHQQGWTTELSVQSIVSEFLHV